MSANKLDIKNMNPQALAFVGDAVHTLYIREHVVNKFAGKPNDLHAISTKYIKASGQSDMVDKLLPLLDDDELDVFRRARNYKTNNIAKNAKVSDYKRATGLEAVVGYIYLCGDKERLDFILKNIVGEINED